MFEFLRVQDPRSLPPWVILQLQVLSLPDVLLGVELFHAVRVDRARGRATGFFLRLPPIMESSSRGIDS